MKNLRFILIFCLFGWGSSIAQNSAAVISASHCEKPEYPSASMRLEEEGTVRLKLLVGIDGKVVESVVEKSSGFKRLDDAARLSLSKCLFKPATIEGRIQQKWTTMTYTWSLGPSRPCNGEDVSKWDRCLGSLISQLGGMTVVEYVQGKQNGAGIEYDKSANVIRSGIFNDGNLVEKRTLDTSKYPFKKQPTEANQANSRTKTQPCSGSDINNWNNCFATTADLSGATYVGEWKAGRWDGKGTHTLLNGDKYIGEFRDGKYNGTGTYYFSDGEKYIGEFRNDLRNGKGTYFFLNGDEYIGEWRDDLRSGKGTQNYADGKKYVGEFSNHKFNGFGTLFDSNGVAVQEGTWLNNNFIRPGIAVGKSEFEKSNLSECVGAKSNSWDGCFGSLVLFDGNKYTGEFRDGRFNGKGTITYKNGEKYIGEFVDNYREGFGTLYSPTGTVISQGLWLKSILSNPSLDKQQPTKPLSNYASERRVALVIGNATYKVNPLKNPVNDSTDMARSLRSVGFDVIEANNTTLAQMREATRRFADKLGNSDVGLVYYSGHGVEVKGKNYLIPVNADIKREYEVVDQAFDASQFLEMMDNIRGPNNKRVNILIVDACRNNELQKSWRSTNNGLARMDAPGGTFISFATAPGRVAADGAGRNSPYTKHLLQALKQPNVPIEQVFKVVRRNVMEETKGEQIPWENSSLVGDFYFTVQR
jgi:TonB family protein